MVWYGVYRKRKRGKDVLARCSRRSLWEGSLIDAIFFVVLWAATRSSAGTNNRGCIWGKEAGDRSRDKKNVMETFIELRRRVIDRLGWWIVVSRVITQSCSMMAGMTRGARCIRWGSNCVSLLVWRGVCMASNRMTINHSKRPSWRLTSVEGVERVFRYLYFWDSRRDAKEVLGGIAACFKTCKTWSILTRSLVDVTRK